MTTTPPTDENERHRGEVEMLRSALTEKMREHTHLQNLLTQAESDRDVARAEVKRVTEVAEVAYDTAEAERADLEAELDSECPHCGGRRS
jgi:transcriptional regulatory protein LevR